MSGRQSYQRNGARSQPARQYRGVRMRRWGKWVSEIRDPITRSRIWLGSFRSAEEAAHAYDAAVVCIRGPNSQPNFPHHNPTIPSGTPGRYSRHEIQAAAVASAAACVGRPFSYSEFLSPTSTTSDSGDDDEEEEEAEEELEDITYTGPSWSHQAAESVQQQYHIVSPATIASYGNYSNNSSYSAWSTSAAAGQQIFDDPYEREWVNSVIFPSQSPRQDDSDDEDDSFVEPISLWSYRG